MIHGDSAKLKARGVQWLSQREHSVHELRQKLLRHAKSLEAATARQADVVCEIQDSSSYREGANNGLHDFAENTVPASAAPPASPEEAVEEVLVWLQSQGYLSDTRFVHSRLHVRSQRFGNLRIRQELAQHQVKLPPESALELRVSEKGRAQVVCDRKFGASAPTTPVEAAKRARFLAQRGFSSDVIRQVLRGAGEAAADE